MTSSRTKQDIAIHAEEVEVGGVPARYLVGGEGEPVVFIHGLSGSTRWWDPVLPVFTEKFRVHVLDLPGFGTARGSRFVLADAPAWVLAWMDAVNLRSAHLVGHSMGGYIVLRIALQRPSAVCRQVVVSAAIPSREGRLLRAWIPLAKSVSRLGLRYAAVVVWDAVRAGPLTLLRAGRDTVCTDNEIDVSRIQVPTLLVWGKQDRAVPLEVGARLRDRMPNAVLAVIDGAGHVPMFERPREFCELVIPFLACEAHGT